ncbi:hypothetical protein J3F83DRAFT_66993 [Trichoderma novae-zelandiae]
MRIHTLILTKRPKEANPYCGIDSRSSDWSRVSVASRPHSTNRAVVPLVVSLFFSCHRFVSSSSSSPPSRAQAWMHALRRLVDTQLGGQDACRISVGTVAPQAIEPAVDGTAAACWAPFSSSCVCALRQWPKAMIACIRAPDRIMHAEQPPNESPPCDTALWARVCVVILAAMRVMALSASAWCLPRPNESRTSSPPCTHSLFAASFYEGPLSPSSPDSDLDLHADTGTGTGSGTEGARGVVRSTRVGCCSISSRGAHGRAVPLVGIYKCGVVELSILAPATPA